MLSWTKNGTKGDKVRVENDLREKDGKRKPLWTKVKMDTLLHYIFFLLQPTTCFETDRTPLLVLLEAINEVMSSDDSAHFVFLFLL